MQLMHALSIPRRHDAHRAPASPELILRQSVLVLLGSLIWGVSINGAAATAAAATPEPTAVQAGDRRSTSTAVLCGVDVLQRDGFKALEGKRVGLITNQTGINREGTLTIKLLHDAPNVQLVALFSPEHGIQGQLDVPEIADAEDKGTGLKIFSLYGKTRRPTPENLRNIDTLVFDIQDIGTRFYTYISTLGYAMQEAAKQNIQVVVLDRPNPINGVDVAGPVLDKGRESFVGFHNIPVRHGMTVGELALMFRHELNLQLDLHVIPVEGWQREDFFDGTGLLWVNPSPNMRCLTQALLYPGIGLLETTNLSVGRGTDTPFEVIGAPWLDGRRLAAQLNESQLAGVRFVPLKFTPDSSKFAGEICGGIYIIITDRQQFEPLATGFEIARQLSQLYQDQWEAAAYDRLLANRATWQAVTEGKTVAEIQAVYHAELERFRLRRATWRLYD